MSTEARMAVIPPCDLCSDGTPAVYDSKMRGRTSWAYLCEAHYVLEGVGRLGTGFGQRLVLA